MQSWRDRWSSRHGQARPGWRHLVYGLICAALLYTVIYYPYAGDAWPERWLQSYLEWTARQTAEIVAWVEPRPSVQHGVISGAFSMRVVLDCAALDVLALTSAAIVAVPAAWSHKAVGLLAAWSGLIVANLMRLALLYAVGVHAPKWFDFLHEDALAMAMVAVALAIFATWFRFASQHLVVPHDLVVPRGEAVDAP